MRGPECSSRLNEVGMIPYTSMIAVTLEDAKLNIKQQFANK
jgi:hypothetical protein